MQPCKTGDQPYSDPSPNGECSLLKGLLTQSVGKQERIFLLWRHRKGLPGEAERLQDVLVRTRAVPAARRGQRTLHIALVQAERRRWLCSKDFKVFLLKKILFWLFKTKMGHPRPLFRLFSVFSKKHQFYNKLMWKNVHPVYGTGIRTHDLQNMSLLP